MKQLLLTLAIWAGLTGPVVAWEEPARGTATRAALMSAIRPHAEWALGAPVEFVVYELRRDGDYGFAMLQAQRPGGGQISTVQTPMFRRGEVEDWMDVTDIQVLYRKSGNTWVAVHFDFGATDVWFSWEPFCREYQTVIADFCPG